MLGAVDRGRIEDLRRHYEQHMEELGRERLRAFAGGQSAAGIEERRAAHAGLFPSARVRWLRELKDAAGDEQPSLGRLLAGVAAETERVAASEAVAELAEEASRPIMVEGEPVTYRGLPARVREETDRTRRAALALAHASATEAQQHLREKLIAAVWGRARAHGFESHLEAWRSLWGVDLDAVAAEAKGFLAATADLCRDAVCELLRRDLSLDLSEASWHDVLHLLHAPRFHEDFPGGFCNVLAKTFLGKAGLDITAEGSVIIELAWPVEPVGVAVRVPGEIHVVLPPDAGPATYRHFLHELGRALARAHVDRDLPFEDRWLPDPGVLEAWGYLLGGLPDDRMWLLRVLRSRSVEPLARRHLTLLLLRARRQAALHCYQLDLSRSEALSEAPAIHADLLQRALCVSVPPGYHLQDLEPRFPAAHALRARALATSLQLYLRDTFDEDWFLNPRTGPFLSALWREGGAISPDELQRKLHRGSSLALLARRLEEALA